MLFRIVLLLICVGAAFMATYVVALVCALKAPIGLNTRLPEAEVLRRLPENVALSESFFDFYGYVDTAFGWDSLTLWTTRLDNNTESAVPLYWRTEAGWPLRALAGETRHVGNLQVEARGCILDVEIALHPIPFHPNWPEFLGNWVIYTVVLATPVFSLYLPGLIRRQLRLRAGACPICGYPRGHSAVCSECGHSHSPAV